MKNNMCFRLVSLLFLSVSLFGCMNDDEWVEQNKGSFAAVRGLYIVNEGNYTYGNASLSFYDIDSKIVYNDVFEATNGIPLGDVAQSMILQDSLAHIVINNSSKIFTINSHTVQFVGKTVGLTSPRYIHILEDHKAYVTDLYARAISVVDLLGSGYDRLGNAFGEITGRISVDNKNPNFNQHATEKMVQVNDFIFTNCWSNDDKILVLDSTSDQLVDSIYVGKMPSGLELDTEGYLWTVTGGGYAGSSFGQEVPRLTKIDPVTRDVVWTYNFPIDDSPSTLIMNERKDSIYFINTDVYRMSIYDSEPELFLPNEGTIFYSIALDPKNSDLYIGDAIDHVQSGIVYRYSYQGIPIDTLDVGISPSAFCFKEKR